MIRNYNLKPEKEFIFNDEEKNDQLFRSTNLGTFFLNQETPWQLFPSTDLEAIRFPIVLKEKPVKNCNISTNKVRASLRTFLPRLICEKLRIFPHLRVFFWKCQGNQK